MRRGAVPAAAVVMLAPPLLVGCGDDGDDEVAVEVVLSEFVVEPERDTADAGEITFVADNRGGETHELVVVEAASADELPVDDDGAFDEPAFGEGNVLGEVEDVAAGESEELTLDLDAGRYVLLCNLVEEEDGEVESHFADGMDTSFTTE